VQRPMRHICSFIFWVSLQQFRITVSFKPFHKDLTNHGPTIRSWITRLQCSWVLLLATGTGMLPYLCFSQSNHHHTVYDNSVTISQHCSYFRQSFLLVV